MMRLTVSDLSEIVKSINELDKIRGVVVHQIKVGRHTIFLSRESSQARDAEDEYFIVGITEKSVQYNETTEKQYR